nr:hypothetical protein [uncultured Actinoplanes sp.]
MTSEPHTGAGRHRAEDNLGSSTEQHITGSEEDGSFITDEPPTATTPAHGSSNSGVNERRANRQEPES